MPGPADDRVAEIVQNLSQLPNGESYETDLSVDDRVLARVTDGIYRQPASALRELISNSYDADATQVIISTDAPRFERIVVRDNGAGMSTETLAYLLTHIGGSSKRTARGKSLGTVSTQDYKKSPGGRFLIGKIGIGLFAVSQLTQHFQIITKQKGDEYRTSAVVVLRTNSEEELSSNENAKFQTGSVSITREISTDPEQHGTEIVLMNIRKSTQKLLRSAERWAALDYVEKENPSAKQAISNLQAPQYHVGTVDAKNSEAFGREPSLPWKQEDAPLEKFRSLFYAITSLRGESAKTPTIEVKFDNYLSMLWSLSLAVPVEYLEKHPFETTEKDGLGLFALSNSKGGQAVAISALDGETVGEHLEILKPDETEDLNFKVLIDGVELRHPICLSNELGHRRNWVDTPLLFVGKCVTPFSNIKASIGGGELEFDAYFYWNPTIVPKENNGVLIRVHGASGTLFDDSFLDYRVSELNRLKQISGEVYVRKGLEAALNIDRESFNTSHPHYLFMRDWIHSALRQITNRLKKINQSAHAENRAQRALVAQDRIRDLLSEVWVNRTGEFATPPQIVLRSPEKAASPVTGEELFVDLRDETLRVVTELKKNEESMLDCLLVILAAHGIIQNLSANQLDSLVKDLADLIEAKRG